MKIKRRLFLSNILMIVIPLFVSLAVFFGGLYFYALVSDSDEEQTGRRGGRSSFMEMVNEVEALAETWQNAPSAAIAEDIEKFNVAFSGEMVFLTLYRDGIPLTAPPADEDCMLKQALTADEPISFFSRAHARTVGDYRVVMHRAPRVSRPLQNYQDMAMIGVIVSLICSVFIILITNRFLTRFVFKKIVHGMDTLTHGVHQVRDGNLGFRIAYAENDEFSQVCGDFNEMAARLLESVEARRKDERSRKELIAGISHDLRTPLTSIKAYVEGLEQGVAATQEARTRYINTIKNKARDLEHIIDSLFLFAKLDTGEFPCNMERVDLTHTISEIVDGLKEEYSNRGLDISLIHLGIHLYVNIDVAQMRSIVINIFENSVKYKNKARCKINVEVTEPVEKNEEKGFVSLVISDDGPGVPEEALPKLFDVFYRGDESRNEPGKGSGLGLAIAAKMVGHFEGSIEAANVQTGGLAIKMTFPKAGNGEAHGT